MVRKLEQAVAVFGVCLGVPEENSGRIPGNLEDFSWMANAVNSKISALGKRRQTCREPCGGRTLGWHCAGPCQNLLCGVLFRDRQLQPSRLFLTWGDLGPKTACILEGISCVECMRTEFWRGEVGVYKVKVYLKVWGRLAGTRPQSVSSQEKLFQTRVLELTFLGFRDLSQVAGCTPRDAPASVKCQFGRFSAGLDA